MRRLLTLLIGLVAFAAMMPCAPAAAQDRPHAAMPCHEHGPADAALHVCPGCAVDPDASPALTPPPLVAPQRPARPMVAALTDHRTGFDPPPPRARG